MTLSSTGNGGTKGKIYVATRNDVCVVKLVGDIRVTLCTSIDDYIENVLVRNQRYQDIVIDLTEATAIDSTSLGLLAKISLHAQKHYSIKPTIFSTNPSITKLLNGVGFNQIFQIESGDPKHMGDLASRELEISEDCCEKAARKRVIEAHKILMSLNNENKAAFRELVNILEKESQDKND